MSEIQQALENLQKVINDHDKGGQSLGIGHLTAIIRAQNKILLAIAKEL